MVEDPVITNSAPVAFTKLRFWRFVWPITVNVEVTVDDAVTKPPNRFKVAVVVAPIAVTCARDGVPAVAGQPTPFAKHTATPITVAVAKFPAKAFNVVPEAVLKPSQFVEVTLFATIFVALRSAIVAVVAPNVVTVALPAIKLVISPFVNTNPVPVAFKNEKFCNEALLVTTRFEVVTFEARIFVILPSVNTRLDPVAFVN